MSVCWFHSSGLGNICWICLRSHWQHIKYCRLRMRKKINLSCDGEQNVASKWRRAMYITHKRRNRQIQCGGLLTYHSEDWKARTARALMGMMVGWRGEIIASYVFFLSRSTNKPHMGSMYAEYNAVFGATFEWFYLGLLWEQCVLENFSAQ